LLPEEAARLFIRENDLAVNDLSLIISALTHPSFAQEHEVTAHYQRLEFLGDAVLALVVAEYLYRGFPQETEGVLTKIRARVVCEGYLVKVAEKLKIGQYLLLGRGEELSGGRKRASILADAVEAVIGALYLDQGLEYVRKFILRYLKEEIDAVAKGDFYDYKSRLQEIVQSTSRENVTYKILEESGPAHDKTFVAGVFFNQRLLASGVGKSKKEAEQRAAQKVLEEGIFK